MAEAEPAAAREATAPLTGQELAGPLARVVWEEVLTVPAAVAGLAQAAAEGRAAVAEPEVLS